MIKIPDDIFISLELINPDEKKRVFTSLRQLNEINPKTFFINWKIRKISGTDFYEYKASPRYRIIFKISDSEIEVIDVVHHDKIQKFITKFKGEIK